MSMRRNFPHYFTIYPLAISGLFVVQFEYELQAV